MMSHLQEGLYEKLIDQLMDKRLSTCEQQGLCVCRKEVDAAEAKFVLSKYLSSVAQEALGCIESKSGDEHDDVPSRVAQVAACNRLIAQLSELPDCEYLSNYLINEDCEQLLSLFSADHQKEMARPVTSLSQSSLFTGARAEPSMAQELAKELESADRVDILVSFIKWSGLLKLMPAFKSFTERGKSLRIITTSYMGATDPNAVEELKRLPNTQIKVSYNTKATRLHAKSYMFYRSTGFSTAYIGSSNLSAVAIGTGLEWNVKATAQDLPHVLRHMEAAFESYWNDGDFVDFELEDLPKLEKAIRQERNPNERARLADGDAEIGCIFKIEPFPYQKEILEKLQAQREIHGRYKNLLVAATGTGKTVISAFDYKRFCKANKGQANRLLFVAHREEILRQSLSTFRGILGDRNFGDVLCSGQVPEQHEHLFISIQSFNSKSFTGRFSAEYYDFIIVDEFHHASAPSYQDLLNHFKPKVLLGLTATPERMDGGDVCADYFDNVTAAEIRLPEAINRQLLVPFQYFGVSDMTDLSSIKFTRGAYDIAELSALYTANDERTEMIRQALLYYVADIRDVVGLGFCVSVKHAQYMAEKFSACGIPSLALHGDSSKDERRSAKDKLVRQEIRFIFTVDLYNEGVDIPEVNTILFLRPTESLTIFMQQLGRGLRLCDGKSVLTVLDFIGQQHANYSFENKFKSLIDKSQYSIAKEALGGFMHLPLGCSIQFEKVAMQTVLKNLQSLTMNKRHLLNKIKSFERETGQAISLSGFIKKYDCSLGDIYRHGLFSRLCMMAGVLPAQEIEGELKLAKLFERLVDMDSKRWIELLQEALQSEEPFSARTADERCMLAMLHYSLENKSPRALGMESDADMLASVVRHELVRQELLEFLQLRHDALAFTSKGIELEGGCALDVHSCYTRDQVLAGLAYWSWDECKTLREGVLNIKERKVHAFFVTINKSEKNFSSSTMHGDYAINEMLFHWQSQSTTTEQRGIGQQYINHVKNGETILLFVRENQKIGSVTQPYTFLGKAQYISHRGSRPMSIELALDEPMPAHVFSYAAQAL